jgi:hypothetical protein
MWKDFIILCMALWCLKPVSLVCGHAVREMGQVRHVWFDVGIIVRIDILLQRTQVFYSGQIVVKIVTVAALICTRRETIRELRLNRWFPRTRRPLSIVHGI